MKKTVIQALTLSLVLILTVCPLAACGKPAKYEVLVRDEAGSYTVHVLKVPEGFENVGEEFTAPAKPGQLVIVLS